MYTTLSNSVWESTGIGRLELRGHAATKKQSEEERTAVNVNLIGMPVHHVERWVVTGSVSIYIRQGILTRSVEA